MGKERKEHLSLTFAGEFSLGPKYICTVCGEKLITEKSERTNGQEWYFTLDGRRHYKHRCNLRPFPRENDLGGEKGFKKELKKKGKENAKL